MLHLFLRPAWGAGITEAEMDATKRKITKIAREVSKFTVRTMRAEGIGAGEFDVLHAVRKNPGITQAGVCRITGLDKGAVARQTAKEFARVLDVLYRRCKAESKADFPEMSAIMKDGVHDEK